MITLLSVYLYGRVEIPVFPTVTAKVTFQEFHWDNTMPDAKFTIPKDYCEDRYRFPDLWYFLELTLIQVLTSQHAVSAPPLDDHDPGPMDDDICLLGIDIPMTNLGDSSAQFTILFWIIFCLSLCLCVKYFCNILCILFIFGAVYLNHAEHTQFISELFVFSV